MYDLPGGSSDINELNHKTLQCKVREETGLEILSYTLLEKQVITLFYHYKEDQIDMTLRHSALIYKINNYTGQ